MISLKESILSSTSSGKKAYIYKSLAKVLKNFKKNYEYSGKNTEQVCIPHEGTPYIDNVFLFVYFKDKKLEYDKKINDWLKSIGYKSANKDEVNRDVDLFGLEDYKYYQTFEGHLDFLWEMTIFKVDESAIFIETRKHENFYELFVFSLDINRRANYVEDWKSDQTFVKLIKNELE